MAILRRHLPPPSESEHLIAGIDTKNGHIAVKGWKLEVALTPDEAIPQLDPFVAGYLYTHVDGEGLMQGFPIDTAARLRKLTGRAISSLRVESAVSRRSMISMRWA